MKIIQTTIGGILALAVTAPVPFIGSQAFAWGATGHVAVCEIAYKELTTKARAMVDDIMSAERDQSYQTFHEACGWPDSKSAATNARRGEHFINVPRDWTAIPTAQCHDVDKCLFTAIPADIAVLEDAGASRTKKLASLKFLGHWLGDIHQPLHISFEDDRGGNEILVEGVSGCTAELHAVWDVCIPQQIMKDMGIHVTHPLGEGRAAFGDKLQEDVTDAQRSAWLASLDPLVFANESYADARAPDVGYCFLSGNTCKYSETKETYDANDGKRTFTPTGDYKEDHAALVKERLQTAGVRLGAILNSIAASQ